MKNLKIVSIVFVLFIFLSFFNCFAQVDSIQKIENNLYKKIENYQDSSLAFINNSRRLLLEKFLKKDIVQLKNIKQLLNNKFPEHHQHIALYPIEKVYLGYWTKKYDDIPYNLYLTLSRDYHYYKTKILPAEDALLNNLHEQTFKNRQSLLKDIDSALLPFIEKDFLALTLDKILQDDQSDINQDYINQLSDTFLKKYPESPYDSLIRSVYRYKLKEKPWGWGIDLSLNSGFFNNKLKDTYSTPFGMGIGVDVVYKKWFFFLRNELLFGKSLINQTFNNKIWEKSRSYGLFIQPSAGYKILDTKKVNIVPFMGYTYLSMSPTTDVTDEKPELKNFSDNHHGLSFGLNVDLKLKHFMNHNYKGVLRTTNQLKFRYSYSLINNRNYQESAKGGFHKISISYGGYFKYLIKDF